MRPRSWDNSSSAQLADMASLLGQNQLLQHINPQLLANLSAQVWLRSPQLPGALLFVPFYKCNVQWTTAVGSHACQRSDPAWLTPMDWQAWSHASSGRMLTCGACHAQTLFNQQGGLATSASTGNMASLQADVDTLMRSGYLNPGPGSNNALQVKRFSLCQPPCMSMLAWSTRAIAEACYWLFLR